MSSQTISPTQPIARDILPVPRAIERNKYCLLEYTPSQRRYLATRPVFESLVLPPAVARPVPGNPHAMTIEAGVNVLPDGTTTPFIVTEHVPGVLVQSDEFVAGFHFGMSDAYEASEEGEESITEQEVVKTFAELAADAVMLGNAELPTAFSAGYYFGYIYGCSISGTPAFQRWAEGASSVAVS